MPPGPTSMVIDIVGTGILLHVPQSESRWTLPSDRCPQWPVPPAAQHHDPPGPAGLIVTPGPGRHPRRGRGPLPSAAAGARRRIPANAATPPHAPGQRRQSLRRGRRRRRECSRRESMQPRPRAARRLQSRPRSGIESAPPFSLGVGRCSKCCTARGTDFQLACDLQLENRYYNRIRRWQWILSGTVIRRSARQFLQANSGALQHESLLRHR